MLPFSKTVTGKVFCCKISRFCKGVKPKDDEGPATVSFGSRLWGQTLFTLQWPAVSLRAFWIYSTEGLQRERGASVLLGQNVCFWLGRSLIQERQSGTKDRIISLFNAVVILTNWNHTSSEISIWIRRKFTLDFLFHMKCNHQRHKQYVSKQNSDFWVILMLAFIYQTAGP